MRLSLSVALALPLLVACDPLYGVRSTGTMPASVGADCVPAALVNDPAFANARAMEAVPDPMSDSHGWTYGENNASILEMTRDGDRWSVSNSRLRIGTRFPAPELDRSAAAMAGIDAILQARCGFQVSHRFRS